MKILINDDLELVTRQFKYILEREFDYEIIVSNDSRTALDIYRRDNSIKLILTDLMMPCMNGLEFANALRNIKRVDDDGTQIPPKIVLVTAVDLNASRKTSENELLNLAIMSGHFDEVISKPVNRNELVLCISKILAKDAHSGKTDVLSVESICDQIDKAALHWGIDELKVFEKYLKNQLENISELQSNLLDKESIAAKT